MAHAAERPGHYDVIMKMSTRGSRRRAPSETPCPTGGRCDGAGSPDPARYRISVLGHLDCHWSDWLDGLALGCSDDGSTVLTGEVRDQSALYGILMKLRDLGLTLVSVQRIDD